MTFVNGQSFEVNLDPATATVFFKGALRLTGSEDYAPILTILRATLAREGNQVIVDLRELDFLNSSGITMFSRFVIEARDRGDSDLTFVASDSAPWHARSLKNLQRLMPALQIRIG